MAKPSSKMGLPRGRAPGSGEGPALVRRARERKLDPGKDRTPPGADLVARRHPDWSVNQILWRRLLDSYEGGQRYRDAEYGADRKGQALRNLVRHKREYPDALEFPNTSNQGLGSNASAAVGTGNRWAIGPFPGMMGADPTATAQDDEYEYRRARTTVPPFMKEVVDIHTGKIYDQQISREGPPELLRWWADCTGSGTPVDDWMREDVAKLLLALGCLDICFDRPSLPDWIEVNTRRDEIDNGLDTCVAAVILPVNMVWWANDPAGRYTECLVREYWGPSLRDPADQEDPALRDDAQAYGSEFPGENRPRDVRYRHWTTTSVALYDAEGEFVEPPRPHGYPCVPILRLIDRKRHRTPMIGDPRYEEIADYQRDYYNRDSELILNNTLQASPLLTGPEKFCRADQTLSIGAGYVLPIPMDSDGRAQALWGYVAPPNDPSENIRESLKQIREAVDRAACLTKPAGVTGTTGGTVSQSGYSKAMDADSGNKLLGGIAKSLARAERQMAEFALMCVLRRPITPAERAAIRITYPARFQLKQAQEILNELTMLVNLVAIETQATVGLPGGGGSAGPATPDDQQGGNPGSTMGVPRPMTPTTKVLMPTLLAAGFDTYARAAHVGQSDDFYRQVRREAMAFFHLHAFQPLGTVSEAEAMRGHGSEEQAAGQDPTGRSASTSVSPQVPSAF